MEIEIKKATLLDHSAVLSLLFEWFNELSINGLPNICGYTGVWLADLIAKHVVITASIDNKIVGILGMRYGFMSWNNEKGVLFNEFLMTHKDFKDQALTDKMIIAAKDFAKQAKLVLITGHYIGTNIELKDKFSAIDGFKYGGNNLFYKGE